MSTSNSAKVVLGCGGLGASISEADAPAYLENFRKYGFKDIDTAAAYPNEHPGLSEKLVADAASWATISTKIFGFGEHALGKEKMTQSYENSLESLKGAKLDILYFHAPDPTVPLAETLEAVNDLYKQGVFARFGISNYPPEDVEEMISICEEKGYVKPSVYQGNYNAISRKGEDTLYPILRKHGMALYAYGPSAAGFFSGKVNADSVNKPTGRWSKNTMAGQLYSSQYMKDEILAASQKVQEAAKKHGINGHAVALRWCRHHSWLKAEHGDAMIVGASSLPQWEETLRYCDEGPLPDELVKAIDDVWPSVKPVAPWAWMDFKLDKELDELRKKHG